MADKDDKFNSALASKKIPILTIDKKYLDLVAVIGDTPSIKEMQEELNNLLKAQGKANNDIKEIKKLKKKLMQEIIENADETSGTSQEAKDKKADDNTRLINECNEKIEKCEDDLLEIPHLIDDVNRKLMMELMDRCYQLLKANEVEIDETAKWITKMRIELKKRLVRKTDMETQNAGIYSYMHDIFGPEVVEIFDMTYKDTKLK